MLEYVSKNSKRKDYEDSFKKYERELKVPYYLMFYPDNQEMTLYHHNGRRYVSVKPDEHGRCALPELELEMGILEGWVRVLVSWRTAAAARRPATRPRPSSPPDRGGKARADGEKLRADGEKLRADDEKRRADDEKRRADDEKRRADELRQRLEAAERTLAELPRSGQAEETACALIPYRCPFRGHPFAGSQIICNSLPTSVKA